MKPAGRLIISHPLGRGFIDTLKKNAPYPLDDFPDASEAQGLLAPYGFDIQSFVDEPELYILTAAKQR
jgi:hypothetical protein